MMILFPYVLAGIGLGVLAVTLAVTAIALVVPTAGGIVMSLLGFGRVLGAAEAIIDRELATLRDVYDDLRRGRHDRSATA